MDREAMERVIEFHARYTYEVRVPVDPYATSEEEDGQGEEAEDG